MRLDLITPVLKLGPLDPVKVATGRSIEDMLRLHMVGPMKTELRDEGPVQVYPCELRQDLVLDLGSRLDASVGFRPRGELLEVCLPHALGQAAMNAARQWVVGEARTERAAGRGAWWAVIPVRLPEVTTVSVPLGPVLGELGLRAPRG